MDTPNDNLNNDGGGDDDDDKYLFLVMMMLIISDFAFEGFRLLYKLFKLFLEVCVKLCKTVCVKSLTLRIKLFYLSFSCSYELPILCPL